MMEYLLILILILLFVSIAIQLLKKPYKKESLDLQLKEIYSFMKKIEDHLERSEKSIKDEFQRNREENNLSAKANREELSQSLTAFGQQFDHNVKELNRLLKEKFDEFRQEQKETGKQTIENIKEINESVEKQLKSIREDNTAQLDRMRNTVDEKLQKTLNQRLSQSFETVGKQLEAVREGLGEMKMIAADVGGLKKVLSNVKIRGGIGEIQLSMLLEQILAPDQYEANICTKAGSSETVEFAIKLPGRDDSGKKVWLPIDAKFPKDIYEQLQYAQEEGDAGKISVAQRTFESAITRMAKEISEKYLDPPNTTDFGIMFLPFEGIYAEVARRASLLEKLQREYKILITGPTTLAAILNSLQMGFRTLAIQKRSSEVWQILGAVKKEFENFGGMMSKAQKNIQTGLNQLDDVMGKRTRAIQRKLKSVETLSESEAKKLIPSLSDASSDSGPEEEEEEEE